MRPVLYQLFPTRLKRYVEVFGGSGALLFGREPQKGLAEVYNDYNSDLVNLFTCVRDRPLALMDELGYLPLNSREEFEALRRFLRQKEPDAPYLREELELCQKRFPPPEAEELAQVLLDRASLWDVKRAAAYYKVIRYSYGAGGGSFGGQATDIRRTIGQIWTCSRRLGDVVIENLSYETIIPRYDGAGTLLYLDPPYYQAECYDVPFCLLDHMRLHSLICGCRNAFVALSYNDHPVIRELYQGFWQFTTTRPNPLGNRSGGGEYEELVITSYDPEVWSRPPQLSLFQTPEREPGEKKYTMIREGERNAEKRKEDGRAVRELLQQRYGKKRLCAGAVSGPGGGDGKDRISSAADRSGMEQLPG